MNYIRSLFASKDMTEGKVMNNIIIFTIPMLLGNIAQQLYSTVDSIVVGKYIGDNALAAVGSSSPILNLLLVLFVGISVGAGIMVSQYFGAKQRENLSHSIGTCITLTAIASLIVMIIGPLVTKSLLHFLQTPESLINWCSEYLNILFITIAGMAYYNILSGVLRGLGDSISALVYLLIATVVNIVLDIYFVASLNMGIAGVAWATAIAQALSSFLCLLKLRKMTDIFDLNLKYLKPEKNISIQTIKLGLPSGFTQAIFSFGLIAVQSLTNSFGEAFIACNVIIMRVDGFAVMPTFSFGNAMTTFTGQNIGAKKMDRVVMGAKQGTVLAVITSSVITVILLLFGKNLMSLFTDTKEIIDLSASMMSIIAAGYIAMAVTQSLSGVMRGAGDTVSPMWISIVTMFLIRIPIAYGLAYFTKSSSCVFISLLVSWVAGALITYIVFRQGKWKTKAITE